MRVLAVDVCGTLFNTNTSLGLVLHHHRRSGHRFRKLFVQTLSSRKLPFTYACTILRRCIGFDLHRYLTLLSLRGVMRGDLSTSAESYVDVLASKEIPLVHTHLRRMIADGWTPILVSNSVSAIIGPIAKKLSMNFIASELCWTDDRCMGCLDKDLTGAKRKYLEDRLGRPLDVNCFSTITDNESDIDLIEAAGIAMIVSHGPKRKWMRDLDAEFLYI